VALPAKALKIGQEDYWLDQIATNREEYLSGKGESPGRWVGSATAADGLTGVATAEQVRALFRGGDPATGKRRCRPRLRADPRSTLAAGPLLAALKEHAAAQGAAALPELARSKALAADIRSVQAACRLGASRRGKVETVERLCRMLLKRDPRGLYGERFAAAWAHKGRRIDARVAAWDLCFSSPKSVSLLAAGGGAQRRQQVQTARAAALDAGLRYLEAHGLGCGASTTAPTATRPRVGWSRSRSSTAPAAPATRSPTPTCWCGTPPGGRTAAGVRSTPTGCMRT
jgi:hypothetical protein